MDQPFRKIDAVLLSHIHYDHVAGIDDLRPYCRLGDIEIYAEQNVTKALRQTMPYCFTEQLYPGVPRLNLHDIVPHQDRKSTRLNSSHANISYAVFCLKKKKKTSASYLIQY